MTTFLYAEIIDGAEARRKRFELEAPFDTTDLKKGTDGLPLLRPVVEVKPPYDPSLEAIEGPVSVITDTEVTDTWTIRTLTQQELDDAADTHQEAQINTFNSVLFKVIHKFDTRLRVLESKAPQTEAEFRAILKSLS